MKQIAIATIVGLVFLSTGCKEEDKTQAGGSANNAPATAPAATAPATPAAAAPHNRIPIGEKTVGSLKLVATMDEAVKPGGEGAFDLVITGGKPTAVRFWVGMENAEGSVKAKAEEETTDNWHTHAEVPNPLPPGSKFWAEVEPPTGEKFTVSFDIKVQ